MAGYFVDQSVFKKPALPSRYQRTDSSNRASSMFSNTSEYSSLKVKEKIEILERLFPQNDDIWENLVKNIDHLCFLKLTESVLQPNGQRSMVANVNSCPSISSQHRLNYTQSTNNPHDHILQENPQGTRPISQPQDVCNTFIPRRSEQIDSQNSSSVSGYRHRAVERLVRENEESCDVRNLNSKKPSRPTTDENDSSFRPESPSLGSTELSAIVSPLSQESLPSREDKKSLPTSQACNPNRRNSKRPCSENPTNFGSRKRSKLDQDTSSILTSPKKSVRQNNKMPPRKSQNSSVFNSEDLNESLAAFFHKKRTLNPEKPRTAMGVRNESESLPSTAPKENRVRQSRKLQTVQAHKEDTDTDSSQSPQNTVVETKKKRNPSNMRRSEKASNTQPKRKLNTQTPTPREETSDSDEISSRFQKNTAVKPKNRRKERTGHSQQSKSTKLVRKTRVSTSPEVDSDSDEFSSQSQQSQVVDAKNMKKSSNTKKINGKNFTRSRKINKLGMRKTQLAASRDEDSDSDEYSSQSQKSSVVENETRKFANAKRTARPNNIPKKLESAVSKTKATKAKKTESSSAQSKNKKAQLQELETTDKGSRVENNSEPSPAIGLEGTVNNSFFSDVSSIIGNQDVSLLRLEKERRSKNRTPGDTDGSLHFLSPFATANSRSTSGFSAISTPLSKSIAKNVLGKRIKKPSVVAELKNEMKPTRKKPKQTNLQKVIQPLHEITANTESECEASDFSDLD